MSYIDGKNIKDFKVEDIIKETINVSNYGVSPLTDFCVGAILETEEGNLYSGCNFELMSALYTLCAERSAISKAVSCGEKNFKRVYIYGHKRDMNAIRFIYPCGICLQTFNELCDSDFEIVSIKSESEIETNKLEDFLPKGFAKKR